jgi:predicted DNA-binding WGR domain protein
MMFKQMVERVLGGQTPEAVVLEMPMAFYAVSIKDVSMATDILCSTLHVNGKPIWDSFMTVQEGSSNKFHYFAVFQTDRGDYVAGNAWGRIGYQPKAIEIARGDVATVESAMRKKVAAKHKKGYVFDHSLSLSSPRIHKSVPSAPAGKVIPMRVKRAA